MTHRRHALTVALLPLLAACAQQTSKPEVALERPVANAVQPGDEANAGGTAAAGAEADRARIYKGTGVLIRGQEPGGKLPSGPPAHPPTGPVVLNFEAADLREVVRNILGDILNQA
jgi:hypothetical protein